MTVFPTSSTGETSGAAPLQSSNPFGFVEGAHFMQLLLAQLRHQNPLEPMQDKDMMGQLAQINSLQELQKINAALESIAAAGQLTDAAGLIGKTVQFLDEKGQAQSGQVTGVSLIAGQVILTLDEWQVPLPAVLSVSSSEEAPEPDSESETGE